MISYLQLTHFTLDDYAQLVCLIRQLSSAPRNLTLSDMYRVGELHFLTIARDQESDGRIVGTALLVTIHSLSHLSGHIEDVVVDEAYRGRGIGRSLTQYLIDHARTIGIERIDLCSEPERESANRLYLSLGFTLRNTNLYRLKL